MTDRTDNGLEGLIAPPLSRRGFVMTSLMSGLTLATTAVEAQVIHTDATGIEAGEVKIPAGDGPMPAYRAVPEGTGPFPIVLVVEEIFGVHEYIKDICRRLAKTGYCAVAPELYARQGDLSTMTDPKVIVRDVISKTPDAQWIGDLDATAAWAASASKGDLGRLGVMGWCRGGRAVWLYDAHRRDLKAAVAWYGPIVGERTEIQPRDRGRRCGRDQRAPARSLRRRRYRHPRRRRRGGPRQGQSRGQERRTGGLSGSAARLPRGLPAELSQGCSRGWLEPGARLPQGARCRISQ